MIKMNKTYDVIFSFETGDGLGNTIYFNKGSQILITNIQKGKFINVSLKGSNGYKQDFPCDLDEFVVNSKNCLSDVESECIDSVLKSIKLKDGLVLTQDNYKDFIEEIKSHFE